MTQAVGTVSGVVRLRPLFVAVVLTGSFLLFLIQPMFARMVLPRLGGSPSCGRGDTIRLPAQCGSVPG